MPLRRLLFIALLCLAFGPVAAARADSEPNNALVQAEGPIAGGTDISGSLPTGQDDDWYVLYIKDQQQVHFTYSSDPGCTDFVLRDTNGSSLSDDYTSPPGTNRFFVQVEKRFSDCDPSTYKFRIDPGAAVVTGPAMPKPEATGEPNESNLQAAGPLQGGIAYAGSLDTSNDQDWFYFYTPGGTHQLDLAVTGPALDDCSLSVALTTAGGDEIGSASSDSNSINHITFTSTQAAMYLVHAEHGFSSDCVPAHWQFEIDPADSVTTSAPGESSPPPPDTTPNPPPASGPSHACRVARARVRHDLNAQRKLKRQLGHAHGTRRRSLVRRLKAVRRDQHRAVGQRRLHCGY
jgi:hypothetical protein